MGTSAKGGTYSPGDPPDEGEPRMERCVRCEGSGVSAWCLAHNDNACMAEDEADNRLDGYCLLPDLKQYDTPHTGVFRACSLCNGEGLTEVQYGTT